jgi:hypothetical protein
MGSCQSGQLELTVNQPRKLRRFESFTAHQQVWNVHCGLYSHMGGCQSGQLELTVNQPRKLRRFESFTAHLVRYVSFFLFC